MDNREFSKLLSFGRGQAQRLRAALEFAILGSTFDDLDVELTWTELEHDLHFGRGSL